MFNKGFSIVELLIALFIGVLILGGVGATYVSMKVTTRDTMVIGEMQETGRLALDILKRDIEQVGFWGTFYEEGFSETNVTMADGIANPRGDCFGGINNGSFPSIDPTNFRSVFATLATSSDVLNCISNAKKNTDVVQFKFLEGKQLAKSSDMASNRYYFIADQEQAIFTSGVQKTALPTINSTLWPYSHHVYYVTEQEVTIRDQKLMIPVLSRKRLTVDGGMRVEVVMEGVEDIRFVFGLDTDADYRVDSYRSTEDMKASDWERLNGILTVQIFVLVRALEPDPDLSLKNRTYTLGSDPDKRVHNVTDNFRRTVFSTTVRLNNMGTIAWRL
ncbi:pilus assembly protein PilW [Pseudoalteromonas sp. JBTF-M23]|uniref:Pilus assembly protein PilW n=1 Tax=Pseudoalteromonas caenipelagi TaxID=2726988 RepID=A0A849VBH3_9GAMM|nr:PilW family protein [Pseudoalteromonas caenipelagi]NOU50636.1 pilus assembly protein PilW [Pseudoalteromonas caenipelagi]